MRRLWRLRWQHWQLLLLLRLSWQPLLLRSTLLLLLLLLAILLTRLICSWLIRQLRSPLLLLPSVCDLQLNILHPHALNGLQGHVEALDVQVQGLLSGKHLRALAALVLLHHMVVEDVLRPLAPAGKCQRAVWTVKGSHGRVQLNDVAAVLEAVGEPWPVLAEAALEG